MPIVTISREYGAGASRVARIVASELGVGVVDKYLVDEVSKRLTIKPGEVEAVIDRPQTLVDRFVRSMASLEPALGAGWMPPFPEPFYDPRKEIITLTEQIIREAAASRNVVIVGRGAGFVLRDHPGVFRVFLRAPDDVRVKTLMARDGFGEAETKRRMHETDTNRAAYIKQLYGHDWCDPSEYDLIVNTGRVGYATAAHMILCVV